MPEWTSSPPPTPTDFTFRLIRVPAFKAVRCVILAAKLTGCRTHYYKGRTIPCEESLCEACLDGHYWRWHAYIPCQVQPTTEKVILELTAQATEQLQPALREFGTLRGLELLAERPSKRPNGRIRITVAPGRRPDNTLPAPPDVTKTMRHIWGLDDQQMQHHAGKLNTDRLTPAPRENHEPKQNESTVPTD
jgi:hypothetical protein